MQQDNSPPSSHISATFQITLDPIPATTIAHIETQRRDANLDFGLCKTGCSEIDDYVLQGGLERGSVVGLSSENEEFSVTVGGHHSRLPLASPTDLFIAWHAALSQWYQRRQS